MSADAFSVVRQFEGAIANYAGARYCVAVTSCTSALLLACAWHLEKGRASYAYDWLDREYIEIPRYTYVGVAQSIIGGGGRVTFRNEAWRGEYELRPLPVWDCARWLRADMYRAGQFMALSFHHTKHLGLASHGGAILHDSPEADAWLRRARFDGRAEGVPPMDDHDIIRGWHAYMTPATAAEGLMRLAVLPRDNDPLPNSDYPDLSKLEVFQ